MSAVARVPPRDWAVPPSDVLLADGSIAVIRTLRPEDRQPLLDLHAGVSADTLRLRFFTASRDAAPTLRRAPLRRDQRRVGRDGRGGPRPGRRAGHRRGGGRRARGGRVPGVRRGPRPRARHPAARAPRRPGACARADPLRGRGARSQLRHAARVPWRRVRGLATDRRRRGLRRAAHRRVGRGPRRRRPARVALGGPLAAAPAGARERRRGRRTPARRWAGPGRPRRHQVGRVRRPAQRRAPRGRRGGRRAGVRLGLPGAGPRRPRGRGRAGRPGPGRDGRRLRCGRGRGRGGLVGADRRQPDGRRPRPPGALSRAQRAARRAQLTGRHRGRPQRVVRPYVAEAGRAGRGHPVRRGRVHRPRPGARPGGRRALVRLAGREARRVQQRPAGRVGRGRDGDGRRAVPRVVRQRAEVRADRSPVRRAQAAARRGRGTLGRRQCRRLRPVRAGRRDPVPGRRRHRRDRGRAHPAAAARRVPDRRAEQRRRDGCDHRRDGGGRGALGAGAVVFPAGAAEGAAASRRRGQPGRPRGRGVAGVRAGRRPARAGVRRGRRRRGHAGTDHAGRPGGPARRGSVGGARHRPARGRRRLGRRPGRPGARAHRLPHSPGRRPRAGARDEVRRVAPRLRRRRAPRRPGPHRRRPRLGRHPARPVGAGHRSGCRPSRRPSC